MLGFNLKLAARSGVFALLLSETRAQASSGDASLQPRNDYFLSSIPFLNSSSCPSYGGCTSCTDCLTEQPSYFGCTGLGNVTQDCFCSAPSPLSCCYNSEGISQTDSLTLDSWMSVTCPSRPVLTFDGLPECARDCVASNVTENFNCKTKSTACFCDYHFAFLDDAYDPYARVNMTSILTQCLDGACAGKYPDFSETAQVANGFYKRICTDGIIPTQEIKPDTSANLQIDPSHYGFCWLPEGVSVPKSTGHACSSTLEQLLVLGTANIVAIAASIILGRSDVRSKLDRLKFWKKGYEDHKHWTPWSGLLVFVGQVAFAAATAAIIRLDGFNASFTSLLLLWFTRPRFGWISMFWYLCVGSLFRDTATDSLLTECLMGILSFSFPVSVIVTGSIGGHTATNSDPLCRGDWARFASSWQTDLRANTFSLYNWSLVLLGLCAVYPFVLAILLWYGLFKKLRLGRFWAIIPLVLTATVYAVSWIVWFGVYSPRASRKEWSELIMNPNIAFLELAGQSYCPSKTSLAVQGALWGIFPLIANFLRAWVGG
ncbi:MAG: hypothetical protein M4579_005737 [Chaenotheca gracillima]|nr:MAG: hypothetical protein M4579_005737 [Chaenotheca gracillima]